MAPDIHCLIGEDEEAVKIIYKRSNSRTDSFSRARPAPSSEILTQSCEVILQATSEVKMNLNNSYLVPDSTQ